MPILFRSPFRLAIRMPKLIGPFPDTLFPFGISLIGTGWQAQRFFGHHLNTGQLEGNLSRIPHPKQLHEDRAFHDFCPALEGIDAVK
jgi:hypothetical protein